MSRETDVYLDYTPRPWQNDLHRNKKRFSVLVVHRRGGKTVAAIMEIMDAAVDHEGGDGRFAYVAPLLKQARTVSWDYIKHFALQIPGTKVSESDLSVELANGSRIRLYGADNPDSLRGIYLDGVVLDEVAQMRPEVWGEILRPALADRKGWALFIGTPKGINLFSEIYYKALQDDEWFTGLYTIHDTDAIDAEEVAKMQTEMSENEFRQEMLCDFSAATDDVLIPIDLVQSRAGKTLSITDYNFAPKVLGVDVARYGGDRSVIFPRQGLAAFKPRVWKGIDNMSLAAMVAESIERWKPHAVFIDAGRGEGVIDRLIQLGYSPIAVDFGGRPNNARYANKRSEMWDAMAQWLKDGAAIPDMPDLKQDLCIPKYSFANAAGKFALESKDRIAERGMPSPDLADALALTFAFPVHKSEIMQQKSNPEYNPIKALDAEHGRTITEYNPFA